MENIEIKIWYINLKTVHISFKIYFWGGGVGRLWAGEINRVYIYVVGIVSIMGVVCVVW